MTQISSIREKSTCSQLLAKNQQSEKRILVDNLIFLVSQIFLYLNFKYHFHK